MNAGEALGERIMDTQVFASPQWIRRTNASLPLARSIARETKFKSHAYTHCRIKHLNFSVGTRNHDKN